MADFVDGDVRALEKRGITEETCRKFAYTVGTHRGHSVQVASYRDDTGAVVAQHLRGADKAFAWVGDAGRAGLFGQHLWPSEGRRVVVTEGEIDALTVAQAFGLGWPVVSVPNGAQGAKKALQRALEWLEGYESVVLWFDNDEPGRKAAQECAALFTPGRCSLATAQLKDANEVLRAGGVKAVCRAVYDARKWAPGGIVNGAELWDRITEVTAPGIPYPWEGLTNKTGGQKRGTLIMWTSGTGMGKSSAVAQVAYELAMDHGLRVGYVALEEGVARTAQRFMSYHLGKLVHVAGTTTAEEMRGAFDATLGTGRIWLLDHFGSTDSDDLAGRIRYLAKGCECDVIVLDHLSIVVSGLAEGTDERRTIDRTMTILRTLVEETGVIMHVVSHLRRTGGDKGAEEGERISLSHLRGSQSIAQLSDMVLALERNQQAETPEAGLALFRVLKNRATGDTGPACRAEYDRETGRMNEVPMVMAEAQDGGANRDF